MASKGLKKKKEETANEKYKKEIKKLIYGFGDEDEQDEEAVDAIICIIEKFVNDLLTIAYKRSCHRGYSEIRVKDILSLIKHDKKMFYRVIKMLSFDEGKSALIKNIKEEYS